MHNNFRCLNTPSLQGEMRGELTAVMDEWMFFCCLLYMVHGLQLKAAGVFWKFMNGK